MTSTTASLASLRRTEVALLTGAVLGSSALAWATLAASGSLGVLVGLSVTPPVAALGLASAMWLTMTVAMMLPATLPWVLTFARLSDGAAAQRHRRVGMFLAGYGAVWTVFALIAAGAQLGLQRTGWLTAPGPALSGALGGVVLVGVGLFQASGLKEACLTRCRSPVSFFLASWKDGPSGAFRMGLGHGAYCVGCCWALMLAAFALGVMNLVWMALLTGVMAAEKLLPRGREIGVGAGVLSVLVGLWLVIA